MTLSRKDTDVFPGDPRWVRESGKIGGANVGEDEYTGVYVLFDAQGKISARCLIKQDWDNGTLRVAKVMGEGIAGGLLNHIYPEVLGVTAAQFAEVHLLRSHTENIPDQDGKHVYLQSLYIPNYVDDLWKFAFRENYAQEFRSRLATGLTDADKRIMEKFYQKKIQQYQDELTILTAAYTQEHTDSKSPEWMNKVKEDHKFQDYEKKIQKYKNKLGLLSIIPLHTDIKFFVNEENRTVNMRPDSDKSLQTQEYLARELANAKVDQLKRPSGTVFNVLSSADKANFVETRRIISNFIVSRPVLIADFAKMAAARIFLGDFGLHNGNFGVAMMNGEPRIVSLDYGAAFANLQQTVNPFSHNETGIKGFAKYYKNHFLEYDKRVIASEAMGQSFIKLGNINNLASYVVQVMQKDLQNVYDIEPLKEFCKRLNMEPAKYEKLEDYDQVRATIEMFLFDRLRKRGNYLKELGLELVLEHCFDPNQKTVAESKFAKHAEEHPEMIEYILSGRFKEADVIYYDNTECKLPIEEAAKKYIAEKLLPALASNLSQALKEENLDKLIKIFKQCENLITAFEHKSYPVEYVPGIKQFRADLKRIKETCVECATKIVAKKADVSYPDAKQQTEHLAKLDAVCRTMAIDSKTTNKVKFMSDRFNITASHNAPTHAHVAPFVRLFQASADTTTQPMKIASDEKSKPSENPSPRKR